MGIPHKAFYCKRIIFSTLFSFFLLFVSVQAQAYDSLFIVENVTVDVTANDSVSAQNQAFSQAQMQAFAILTKRMVSEADAATVQQPDLDTIASMIKDYEIKNEHMSAVRYVGDFTFRFNEQAVSRFFSVTGVHYTNKSSKPLLVLPIFQIQGKNTIWSERNLWMQAWTRARLPIGVVPVEVPIGDLDDIGDIDDNNALRYERKSLDRMLLRYGADEAAIMIAVPDQVLGGQRMDDIAKGRVRISIYRTDLGSAERVNDLLLEPQNNETVAQIYDRGVLSGYQAIQKDWKNKTLSSSSQAQSFYVRMPVRAVGDLVKAQNTLATLPGFTSVSVTSLKPVEARMVIVFRGDEARLREALMRTHLTLGEAHDSDKRFVHSGARSPDVIYDLYTKQNRSNSFFQPVESSVEDAPLSNEGDVRTF
tara:strand:- start:3746 stop:5008 length:1263 start_codon:yes stop_codon:yes gene_type:complete